MQYSGYEVSIEIVTINMEVDEKVEVRILLTNMTMGQRKITFLKRTRAGQEYSAKALVLLSIVEAKIICETKVQDLFAGSFSR
jgi:hypothetical protein